MANGGGTADLSTPEPDDLAPIAAEHHTPEVQARIETVAMFMASGRTPLQLREYIKHHYHINNVQARWTIRAAAKFLREVGALDTLADLVARQGAILETIIAQQGPTVREKTETVDGQLVTTREIIRGPTYAEKVMAIKAFNDLYGLNAPKRVALTDTQGRDVGALQSLVRLIEEGRRVEVVDVPVIRQIVEAGPGGNGEEEPEPEDDDVHD